MTPQSDPLAQLRDIHLPDPVSAWPPAYGWWILLAVAILTLVFACRWLHTYIKANAYRREAKKTLQKHWADLQNSGDSRTYLSELTILLRRTALTHNPHAAALTGGAWLMFLDSKLPEKTLKAGVNNSFQSPVGQLLLSEPYRAEPQLQKNELQQLQKLALNWVTQHRTRTAPTSTKGNHHA